MNNISSTIARCVTVAAIAAASVAATTANAVTTLTFADNANPINPFPSIGTWPALALTFPDVFLPTPVAAGEQNSEFRMISLGNVVGGGGHKNLSNGGEQWIFSDDINLTSVAGTDTTGGSATPGSAQPAGGTGLFLNAPFFDVAFGFLAPTVGSPAATTYGNGTISVDITGGTIQVVFPVLEAQWGNTHFPLGLVDDTIRGNKITFNGTLSNIQLDTPTAGNATFDFVITAEHVITSVVEDPGAAGFSNWTPQWNLVGTGVAPVVLLNSPSSTDAIAATLPGTAANDGRITKTELEDPALYNAPIDTAVSSSCVGSCFAFTVSGVTGSTQVVLPLSTPIPNSAVYRKLIGGVWKTFDETAGDVVESGPGVQGDCSGGVVYSAGLNAGDFCVRLTITDAGLNDGDGVVSQDGTVIDPGGVGVLVVSGSSSTRAPSSIDDAVGCSISATSNHVTIFERADWLVVFSFLALLALIKTNRNKINQ